MNENTKKELRQLEYRIEELERIIRENKAIIREKAKNDDYLLDKAIYEIQRLKEYVNELEHTKQLRELLLRVAGEEQTRKAGRPAKTMPKDFIKYYTQWRNKEINANRCMELLGLKRTTFYRLVREYEGQEQDD